MEAWSIFYGKPKEEQGAQNYCVDVYFLDIDSIDGVKMGSTLIKMNKHSLELLLEICFDDVDGEDFKNINNFQEWYYYNKDVWRANPIPAGEGTPTHESLRVQLIKLITTLENLKLDTIKGRLTDKPIEDNKVKMTMSSLGKCKTLIDECSVCLENTKTQFTKCGHNCCMRCITNLKITQTCCGNCCDDDCTRYISCPLCRAKINV
tara:strand:- start:71 stop:688 length:618 start_codon:yes stop_codon:yes gene_type:complete